MCYLKLVKMLKYSPTPLSSKTILKTGNVSILELIVPLVVRGVVLVKHTFPYLINPILGKSLKKQLDSMK